MVKKLRFLPLTMPVILSLLVNSCGNSPSESPVLNSAPATSTYTAEQHVQIVKRLDDIRVRLARIEKLKSDTSATANSGTSTAKSGAGSSASPAKSPSTPANTDSSLKESPASPVSSETKNTSTDKGKAILDKLLNNIRSASGIEVMIDRYEQNIDDSSDTTTTKIQMWTNNKKQVKMHVIDSSAGGTMLGAKILYTSGESKEAKVRPGGALGLITTNLSMTDERLLTLNNFRIDDIDLFGIAKRLSQPEYKAELSGVTQINGEKIYILKITSDKNSLDPRISYEHIGFDTATYSVRLWEAYTKDSDKAFFKFVLGSFEFKSIPDSEFKV